MQIPDAQFIETFGQLNTFALIMLFLCLVAFGMLVVMLFALRIFKSTTDGLRDTNRTMSDTMNSQQKSSNSREDKLAAAIERFPEEMNKAAQALLLIHHDVERVRTGIDDTQTNILARLEALNRTAQGTLLTETGDIKDGMGQVYDLIEQKLQIVIDDVAILKQTVSLNPQIPAEVTAVLNRVLGYLETARPKLGTGTFRTVDTNKPDAVIEGVNHA